MSRPKEPSRQTLRGAEVEEWINHCAPEGTFLQQTPRRTCSELGVCQNRRPACGGCETFNALIDAPIKPPAPGTPAKPRTVWAFAVSFSSWDLVGAVALVALAYFAAGYYA